VSSFVSDPRAATTTCGVPKFGARPRNQRFAGRTVILAPHSLAVSQGTARLEDLLTRRATQVIVSRDLAADACGKLTTRQAQGRR